MRILFSSFLSLQFQADTTPTPVCSVHHVERAAGAHSLLMVVFVSRFGPCVVPVLHSALDSSHCLLCFFPLSLFLILQIHTSLALLKNPFSFLPRLHGPRSYVPGITVGSSPPSSPAVSPFLSRTTTPAGKGWGFLVETRRNVNLEAKCPPLMKARALRPQPSTESAVKVTGSL